MRPHTHFLLGGNSNFPPVVDPSHAHDQLRVSCVGTMFFLSMVMLVTIITVRGEATLVVPEKISPMSWEKHREIHKSILRVRAKKVTNMKMQRMQMGIGR